MFTGLVTAIGEIVSAERADAQVRFAISSPYDPDDVAIGASIAHAGCCLTVVDKDGAAGAMRHVVECSPETLAMTTLNDWRIGSRMNLERAARFGDEVGGHLVAGHIDGIGRLVASAAEGDYERLEFATPSALMPYVAPKGSIAIDGVSLTVNWVERDRFSVMIIPHTASVTTLGALREGGAVNLEVDLIARYVARMMAVKGE